MKKNLVHVVVVATSYLLLRFLGQHFGTDMEHSIFLTLVIHWHVNKLKGGVYLFTPLQGIQDYC